MLLSILFCALPLWVADDVAPVNVAPESWVASGRGATLDIRDGALTLHYDAREGARDTALLPLGNFPMTEMKSLRFEIRTDAPFAAAVLLSEKVLGEKKPGGGNYMAAIWSSGDKWQPVVLAPGDFHGSGRGAGSRRSRSQARSGSPPEPCAARSDPVHLGCGAQ